MKGKGVNRDCKEISEEKNKKLLKTIEDKTKIRNEL